MTGFNKVILAGYLTRDPELRYTPNGTPICKGGIAVNRKWRDGQGEMREEVTFVDWLAWGKVGEIIAEHTRKGSPILIEGRLNLEQWEDRQTNQKRSKINVVVENVTFLGSREDGGGEQERRPARNQQEREKPDTSGAMKGFPKAKPEADPYEPPIEEDDVPF